MVWPIYAMDTSFFHTLGAYEFDIRCEMLVDLGYDATYLSLWNDRTWGDVPRLASVTRRFGLDVAGVYCTLDITGSESSDNQRILRLMRELEGCKHVDVSLRALDGSFHVSDPAGDRVAAGWIHQLAEASEQTQLTISLYPHVTFWAERASDAARLCQLVDHPRVGMTFSGFHWYASDEGALVRTADMIAPHLRGVNLCGSRKPGDVAGVATIEPLDEGELDNFVVLSQIRRVGFNGMIGVQGFGVGGDVYAKLQRSLKALRGMEQRLQAHPEWASLRFA